MSRTDDEIRAGCVVRPVSSPKGPAMTGDGFVFDLHEDELNRAAHIYAQMSNAEIAEAARNARLAFELLRSRLDPAQRAVAALIAAGECG